MKGGEKNEEMLVISAGGRDGGHQSGVLCDHDLDDLLEFGIPDRSPARLRSRSYPCSVVPAERSGCHPPLPVGPSRCKQEEATSRMKRGR